MAGAVVFVTDYGRDDAYAAALTGAVLRVDPGVRCVDGSHGVPPGDIAAGAYVLKSLRLAFPQDTVFCAVVDPGVGTPRRALAVRAGGCVCVAPDNGLVSYLWREAEPAARRAVQLPLPPGAASTFHGRDLFAPAAARLARGIGLDRVGDPLDDPAVLESVFARRDGPAWVGEVVAVDHFGNAITTVRASDLAGARVAGASWDGGSTRRVVQTYAGIPHGELALLTGSAGHLEVAARGGAAASLGGPELHESVRVDVE